MSEAPIVDRDDRDRIEHTGLGQTLFVEAGAGTGKTHELVERVSRLVIDENVPLRYIAAITFTEAAGAELRDRIRETFEARLTGDPPEPVRQACEAALADSDIAAIGTLHSFALRILSEQPLEAGLPPRVEVLDEVSSQLAFEDRWKTFVDDLHDDPDCADLLLQAEILGIPVEPRGPHSASLKDVAAVFGDNYDRLDGIDTDQLGPLPDIDWAPLERAVDALADHPLSCQAADDLLLARIEEVILPQARAVLAETDPFRRLQLISDDRIKTWKGSGLGGATRWDDVKATRAACDEVGEAARTIRTAAIQTILDRFRAHVARFTIDAAALRQREGRLEFHDLLVLARRLVRQSAPARSALHQRYQRLLLDEFQDTDPIQIEIATLIAAPPDNEPPEDWAEVAVEEGRLFFVGDPKQSIYRFRRADIGLFLSARNAFAADGPVPLVQNFRTVEPIVSWVNHVFDQLMAEEVPGAQPRYRPLQAYRTDPPGDHRVTLLGGPLEGMKAGEMRDLEAADVAATVAAIRDESEQWPVFDERTETWRPPTMADVTVLLPTRTSLRQLEDAFDAAAVPYRVDTGTLVYDTQEVREVLAALRAIDDPTDEIALVTALRSPLYGCSDVDLFTYFDAGGRWDLRHKTPPSGLGGDHPVVEALAHLRLLWNDRWWNEPSALMGRLLQERRAFALAFGHRRPREVWRRLRFLVDQAHQFQEAGGGGLRRFLDWAELQRNEGSRVHEPLLPETDDDAVSIKTIHGAKGLEFPITIVTGLTTAASGGRGGVSVVWEGSRPEVKFRKGTATANFDRLADIEAEMDIYERQRLLYVACTRARDHLVVSTYHSAGKDSHGANLATTTADVEDTLCRRLPEQETAREVPEPTAAAPPVDDDDRDDWAARREALLAPQRDARFVSATAVAALGAEEPDDEADDATQDEGTGRADRPAFRPRRGRAGTAIGRAVHATLQLVDLATGDHLSELAAQQAHAEAVPELAATIEKMARSALTAPSVQEAVAGGRLWREVYVAAPVGNRAIEGYIDLLYETGDGLVIVDYKTDTIGSEAEIDAKLDRYRLQLATYALALETSTGLSVIDCRLVFCTTDAAIEHSVGRLRQSILEAQQRLEPRQRAIT